MSFPSLYKISVTKAAALGLKAGFDCGLAGKGGPLQIPKLRDCLTLYRYRYIQSYL